MWFGEDCVVTAKVPNGFHFHHQGPNVLLISRLDCLIMPLGLFGDSVGHVNNSTFCY